ncbi:MAG: CvpA family protein [Clostridia bacterium]|nr:CvpA family protein [Clostridia bacterium]
MSIILDVIILAIVLLSVLLSAKRGFVKSIIEVAGFVAAIILAISVSGPLAEFTYDKVIEPSVIKIVEESAAASDEHTEGNIEAVADNIWNALPEFVRNNSVNSGINQDTFVDKIEIDTTDTVASMAQKASQTIARPIVTKMFSAFYAVVLMVVLLVIVKFIAKIVNPLFNFSIIGKLNRTLGGVLGLVKGILVSVVFCVAVSLIVSFTGNGFLCFTPEAIENSVIFSKIVSVIPFI